ncbi:glycosyltransferase [Mycolicibacterium sp. BiH015]|uniref:glycosyltransferase n=1 Tax=Mycolicibacterium sp. BiH015 TaxID=3018808 RepID=UPI0022E3A215|nr:nucleotide disphospho-sugar-binding domain-containing protein [Mycolicibacterium sp. BiH015]MDA2894620.1 glycosyltransferase [Mycolicibacterium sp. BiH015]
MSSIVLCSIPAHGHVAPLLAVAENFVKRGDDVRFITGSRFADKIAATGAVHVPLPPEADYDESVFDQLPARKHLKGVRAAAFDVEHVFARPAEAQYDILRATLASRPAHVVITEPVFLGAAMLLAHERPLRPAVVMCSVVPLCIDSLDKAPFGMGLPPARVLNRPRNALLTAVQRRLLRRPYRIIDDIHRQIHGTAMPFSMVDAGRHTDALVQLGVASFEYPLSDAPSGLRFIGPLAIAGSPVPLPQWWPDLDGSRPVVHVTQGTVANADYRQTIAPTLEALAEEDVLVVVTTGGRPLDTLPPLPRNARAATFLPYHELLPRTAVYVTNGGFGGVQYALRYGVPIVATGGKEDKPEVGARVAWSGAGRRIRSERPSSRALRREILTVLRDPRYRQASRRIAEDIAAAPGFAGLAAVVDELIDGPTARTSTRA